MTRPLLRLVIILTAICGAALGALVTLVLTAPVDPRMTEDVSAHGLSHPAPVEGSRGTWRQTRRPSPGPTPAPAAPAPPSPGAPRILLV